MAELLTWEELERYGLTECDPRDRDNLDHRLYGFVFTDHEPGQSVSWLRETLKTGSPRYCRKFAEDLRAAIADTRDALLFPWGEGLPEPQDIHRLRDSLREAIARITAWVETHGIESLDSPEEEIAARQGWPDADGKAWTPPWDLLDMEPPPWWGKPPDGSGKV